MEIIKHTIIITEFDNVEEYILKVDTDDYWVVDRRLRKGTVDTYFSIKEAKEKFEKNIRETIKFLIEKEYVYQRKDIVC